MEALAEEPVRPLRRVEYDQLVALGAFEDEKLELLYGALVPMTPIGPAHASVSTRLNVTLVRALADRAAIRVAIPVAASDDSEPEPDFAVVPPGDYDHEHPTAAWLIIEVSDSSLRKDRGVKRRLYAECKVPEYWIVNLVEQVIEVYREPKGGAYTSTKRFAKGDVIVLERFPDVEIRVDDVIR